MKNKKIILLSMISFLTIALSLLIKSNITYGNEENIYNFEDLKVGDYLPFGATIQVNEDYIEHTSSGDFSYGNKVYIEFYGTMECYSDHRSCGNYTSNNEYDLSKNVPVSANTKYKIKTYNEYFNTKNDNKYIGFEVVGLDVNTIYLLAVDDHSKINQTPSETNNYSIDTYFPNTAKDKITNTWYKIYNLTVYDVSENNFWQNNDGILHFLYKGGKQVGDTVTLTYTFNASAGDIISFKTRSWNGSSYFYPNSSYYGSKYDTYEILYNGKPLGYPSGIKYYYSENHALSPSQTVQQNTSLYENVILTVESSGTQTLSFVYQVNGNTVVPDIVNHIYNTKTYAYNYAYIKDLVLLTKINDGTQLDTSKVSDGDNLYYESVDKNGYVLSENLTYQIPETLPEENNTNEVNPNTKDLKLIIYIVVIISSIILLYEYRKLKWLK